MKNYILCYGTIRRGNPENPNNRAKTYNFDRFGRGTQHYLQTLEIGGFSMCSLGPYPAIYKDNENSKITVELHEVEPAAFAMIQRMESGAGYSEEIVNVETPAGEKINATIFVGARNLGNKNKNKIESGDWLTYENKNWD